MDLLYRQGGLTCRKTGELFKIGYSAVSQERKRLNEKINKDKKLQKLRMRIETYLSRIKT